jgi:hypothetical protein
MSKIVVIALLLTLSAGCFRTRVTTNHPPGGVHVVKWSHTFIGGLIGSQKSADCEPAVVETRLGLLGLLAAFVTASIWVPLTVDVECAVGSQPGPFIKLE